MRDYRRRRQRRIRSWTHMSTGKDAEASAATGWAETGVRTAADGVRVTDTVTERFVSCCGTRLSGRHRL
ncbi:hypothetical protein GCM10014715_63100 [Streptomyces spiralis]|uniref:Uncharacterized protein n=1 Tax=Streptomyces spiralis TaxID=66376 RepID=A0A919DYH8_9ACTN|nr:hypothetical protein GCM10014715_63100 [Streptomyces spiralis]